MAIFYFKTTNISDAGLLSYFFQPDSNATHLFLRQKYNGNEHDYYYPATSNYEGIAKLVVDYADKKYLGDNPVTYNTKNEIQIGSKYSLSGTYSFFGIPATANTLNAGKLWVYSDVNHPNAYYMELGLSTRPNNYIGNYKILATAFSGGNYYYSLDCDRKTMYSSEGITAKSITKPITSNLFQENRKYLNYIYDKPLFNNGRNDLSRAIFKVINYKETNKAGFLTNYPNRNFRYFSELINQQIYPIWIYKADQEVVYDTFNYTQLHATVSGTISFAKDGSTYINYSIPNSLNGYTSYASIDINGGGLDYTYNLKTTTGVNKTLMFKNVESPIFSKPINKPDYVIISYINPYGVRDSMLLFCDIFKTTDVERDYLQDYDEFTVTPYGYGNMVSKVEKVNTVKVKNKYKIESDWLSYDEYNQFSEILSSKNCWIFDSRNDLSIELVNGTKAEIQVNFFKAQSENNEFGETTTITINGITVTFNVTGIWYDFADDWMLAEVISALNSSALAADYNFIVAGGASEAAIIIRAKQDGTLFNIVSTNKTGQVFSFTNKIDGQSSFPYDFTTLFEPILIEDSNFVWANDNVDLDPKKLNFTFRYTNIINN